MLLTSLRANPKGESALERLLKSGTPAFSSDRIRDAETGAFRNTE
jgi:hypothetical protein